MTTTALNGLRYYGWIECHPLNDVLHTFSLQHRFSFYGGKKRPNKTMPLLCCNSRNCIQAKTLPELSRYENNKRNFMNKRKVTSTPPNHIFEWHNFPWGFTIFMGLNAWIIWVACTLFVPKWMKPFSNGQIHDRSFSLSIRGKEKHMAKKLGAKKNVAEQYSLEKCDYWVSNGKIWVNPHYILNFSMNVVISAKSYVCSTQIRAQCRMEYERKRQKEWVSEWVGGSRNKSMARLFRVC